MKIKPFITCIFIIQVCTLTAQTQFWKKTNGPSGCFEVFDIEIDPTNNNIMYATTNRGAYKTINKGELWVEMTSGTFVDHKVHGIEVDYTNSSILYTFTHYLLYKSTDGGGTWIPFDVFPDKHDIFSLTIDPYDPTILYCGTVIIETDGINGWARGNLWKSSDSGTSWQVLFSDTSSSISVGGAPHRINTITVSPHDSSTIYCGFDGAGIIVSKDRGATWTYKLDEAPLYDRRVLGFTIHPKEPNTIYVGTDAGNFRGSDLTERSTCYKSTDGGDTWTLIIDYQDALERVRSIHIHPTQPDTLYLCGDRVLYCSYDGGTTFREEIKGSNYRTAGCFDLNLEAHQVIFTDPPTIYSGGYGVCLTWRTIRRSD